MIKAKFIKKDREMAYPIPEADSYYISRDANIYSNTYHFNQNPNRELRKRRLCNHTAGYKYLALSINGIKRKYYVHRLMLKTFLAGIQNEDETVNHKNGIKTDNRVENLEWVSYAENNRHARLLGLNKSTISIKGREASLKIRRERAKMRRNTQ